MLNKNFKTISVIIFSLGLIFSANFVQATSSSFILSTSQVIVGDVFVAELKLADLKQIINAMDGLVIFDPSFLEVQDVSLGDSVFTLWPRTPDFASIDGKIMFTGGVPSGTMGGSIVKVVFLAKKTGPTNFYLSDNSILYLNDGQGTKTSAQNQKVSLIIQLGKDPYTFEGQYFISFFAEDKESGIDHYEVKEGDKDFVTTASPYILSDQSLKSKIFVKAVDKNGNEKVLEFKNTKAFYLQSWFISLVIILIIYFIWHKKKSNRK